MMKRMFHAAAAVLLTIWSAGPSLAQSVKKPAGPEESTFAEVTRELASRRFSGRGYARDGVVKAGRYIEKKFREAGVDSVVMQPFRIDINTFPGRMALSVDGRKLEPGRDFVLREYSCGVKGTFPLYYVDTLDYCPEKIFSDLEKPEYKDAFVVCDFWFTYKHKDDFRRLEKKDGAPNAGILYLWDTPLKFYKAYGEKVSDKPVIWGGPGFPQGAGSIKADIRNKFFKEYESSNVIAMIPGRRHDSCYVFTAHYDHLGNLGRKLYFPGVNDNASGTAGIIDIAAEYARAGRSGKTTQQFDIWFVAFAGEEANLRGSTFFVDNPPFPLESVKYLFNLDMVGDNNPVQYCEVSDAGMRGFEDMCRINDQNQSLFDHLELGELAANSDHWPFACKGVPCILFENQGGDYFKDYHTADDCRMEPRTFESIKKIVMSFIEKQSPSLHEVTFKCSIVNGQPGDSRLR